MILRTSYKSYVIFPILFTVHETVLMYSHLYAYMYSVPVHLMYSSALDCTFTCSTFSADENCRISRQKCVVPRVAQTEFRKIDKYIYSDAEGKIVEQQVPGKFKWESAPGRWLLGQRLCTLHPRPVRCMAE